MAIVILGGLLSATALNMLVLPALYWVFGDRAVATEDAMERIEPAVGLAPVRAAMVG